MNTDKRLITVEEAISLLNEDERVHTFRDTSGMLLGADIDRVSLIEILKSNSDKIEIGGEQCRRMKHGIVVNYKGNLFIETNTDKLNDFDPIND